MLRWLLGAFAATAAVMALGCMLITGSTDGYSEPDAAIPGFACALPGDCAGKLCCLQLTDGGVPTGSSCETSCADPRGQVCGVTADCADAGSCWTQTCAFDGGFSVQVKTCGALPVCSIQ